MATKKSTKVKCPECGKQMEKGGKCPSCGYTDKKGGGKKPPSRAIGY